MNYKNAMSRELVISLFGPSVRPWLWERLYDSLSSNMVPFEIIFVGNRLPTFTYQDNIHFIYSEVKPAQCAEIGSRYATGDFLMNIADDIVFSEHALDILYEAFNRLNDDKVIVCPRYSDNGRVYRDDESCFWKDDLTTPTMPACGLMKKDIWKELGGIDVRFVALYWDLDIAMRLYERGGRVVIVDEARVNELRPRKGVSLFEITAKLVSPFSAKLPPISRQIWDRLRRSFPGDRLCWIFGPQDRVLLDWFWSRKTESEEISLLQSIYTVNKEKGVLSRTRLSPVIPFTDKDILTVSQGPKGRWR